MSNVNLREVARLVSTTNFSNYSVARMTGFSPNTVSKYRKLLLKKNYTYEHLVNLNDKELGSICRIARQANPQKRMPDWNFIHSRMQARHQTLIELWEEYCLINAADAYSYSQFTHYYREHIARIDVSMRQVYYSGEIVFVDYAGRTIPWFDEVSGQERKAQIFLGVLGCSNYSFVRASASQKLEDWIEAHVKMFDILAAAHRLWYLIT